MPPKLEPPIGDRKRWEVAAKMLDDLGDDVGDYVIDLINRCMTSGDKAGTACWLKERAGQTASQADNNRRFMEFPGPVVRASRCTLGGGHGFRP